MCHSREAFHKSKPLLCCEREAIFISIREQNRYEIAFMDYRKISALIMKVIYFSAVSFAIKGLRRLLTFNFYRFPFRVPFIMNGNIFLKISKFVLYGFEIHFQLWRIFSRIYWRLFGGGSSNCFWIFMIFWKRNKLAPRLELRQRKAKPERSKKTSRKYF